MPWVPITGGNKKKQLVRFINKGHCTTSIKNACTPVGLDNISVLSFIVILKCHDNRYRKDFSVSSISPAQYYC